MNVNTTQTINLQLHLQPPFLGIAPKNNKKKTQLPSHNEMEVGVFSL
jgi:hypothetical protein